MGYRNITSYKKLLQSKFLFELKMFMCFTYLPYMQCHEKHDVSQQVCTCTRVLHDNESTVCLFEKYRYLNTVEYLLRQEKKLGYDLSNNN